jgi:hypothetical protein
MNIKKAEAIALLAFLLMIKEVQPNSVLFADAAYKMAARIGMGDGRTFSKHLKWCEDLGLCVRSQHKYGRSRNRTAYSFIAYGEALQKLLGINKYQLSHFPLHRGLGKHTNYKEAVELDFFALNVHQQQFNSRSHFPNKHYLIGEINRLSALSVSGKITRAERSKLRRMLQKFATADKRIAESLCKGHFQEVVTGCQHLGAIIGKSSATAAKRIKKWQENNNIQTENIIDYIPTHSREEGEKVIAGLRASGVKGFHAYSVKENGVKSIIGKRVLAFQNSSYLYIAEPNNRTWYGESISTTTYAMR